MERYRTSCTEKILGSPISSVDASIFSVCTGNFGRDLVLARQCNFEPWRLESARIYIGPLVLFDEFPSYGGDLERAGTDNSPMVSRRRRAILPLMAHIPLRSVEVFAAIGSGCMGPVRGGIRIFCFLRDRRAARVDAVRAWNIAFFGFSSSGEFASLQDAWRLA